TYAEVQAITGLSKGAIYRAALRTGARKTEARIAERHAERRERQLAMLRDMMNSTVKADVLDFMAGLPDDSVACHFTSPPYNVGKRYGDAAGADALRFTFFHGWLMQVVSELARTTKPGGVVCLNVGKTRDWTDALYPMDIMLFEDMRRAGLTFQNRVVWTQPHGLTPSHRLADRYETVLIFSKGPTPTFNPNAARHPQKQPGKRAFKGPNKGELSGHPLGAWPTDVWDDVPTVRANHPDRRHGAHPAQFPVKLAKRAIVLYTKPGDLVCDAFMGSGSVAVAAIEAGRAFVGADLFYEDLRADRIAAATPDTVSMLDGVTDESAAVWQAEARRVDHPAEARSAAAEAAQCLDLFG
ncbi:MAG: site-specific DNA-methyltransferase, partial [Castellaniella sp.]|uniref:DNA-methyltransferase n=1 Tax=Castellaniella sp. TaxID=1955812 RepID=UPI0012005755